MEQQYLKDLVDQRLSQNQIAELVSLSQPSVRYWLKKYDLQTKGKSGPRIAIHKCACGETDPNKFYGNIKGKCKVCMNLEDAERRRLYKERAVQKFGGKCELCGYDKCIAALEFHHRDSSEKDPNGNDMRNWSYERKRAELEKCQLLCANCHREVHFASVV